MGITNFYKEIKIKYPGAFSVIKDEIFEYLYIDLNCILHKCNYNCTTIDELIKKIIYTILEICKKSQPTKGLYLFCDGTSPFAKLLLQRERRFLSNDELSLNFTPGTMFLKNLPNKLSEIINIIKIHLNINVFIDTLNPGESEIKIKNKILENYHKNTNDKHVLITTDADVILILTSDISYKKCYILDHDVLLSIQKLYNLHKKKYNLLDNAHIDFAFLNLFLGNDYLPKINSINFDNLWESYSYNINNNTLIKLQKNKCILDINLLIEILNDILGSLSRNILTKMKNKKDIFDESIILNYFDGLKWNLDMYINGACIDYHFIMNNKNNINIINFIIFLNKLNKTIDMDRKIINKPIDSELCGMLLIPFQNKHLIDSKYNKFLDKNKYIYDKDFIINTKNLEIILKKFKKYSL
jgi:5'-3' exonuclease